MLASSAHFDLFGKFLQQLGAARLTCQHLGMAVEL